MSPEVSSGHTPVTSLPGTVIWLDSMPTVAAGERIPAPHANRQAPPNAANDHAPQGLDIVTYRQTQGLPVYRNGTRVYGTEP